MTGRKFATSYENLVATLKMLVAKYITTNHAITFTNYLTLDYLSTKFIHCSSVKKRGRKGRPPKALQTRKVWRHTSLEIH